LTSRKPRKATSARGRQDGDYTPPIVAEPAGGPVPTTDEAKDAPKEG
jgi:hypothetical protein